MIPITLMKRACNVANTGRTRCLLVVASFAFLACSANGEDRQDPTSADAVAQTQAPLSTVDVCGDQCGGVVLAAGEACCRSGIETAYAVDQKCCTPTGVQPKYPITDLSACPNRVPHPGYALTTNGCSVQAPLAAAVANGGLLTGTALAFYSNLFYAACNVHDSCYGTCNTGSGTDGSVKASCDSSFQANARQTCFVRFADRPVTRAACLRAASAFFHGVRLGGGPFYAAAQREACDCCAGDASCTAEEVDLSVTGVAFPNAAVAPGDGVQFQFYVNNQGPGAATNISARIDLTAGLSQPTLLVHAPGNVSVPCSIVALTGGGNLATCSVPRLEPGETATIEGSAATTLPGQEAAFAAASSIAPEPSDKKGNNFASANWLVECPQGTTWDVATQQCDCVPQAVVQACVGGQNCGTAPDGCGGMVACGPECTQQPISTFVAFGRDADCGEVNYTTTSFTSAFSALRSYTDGCSWAGSISVDTCSGVSPPVPIEGTCAYIRRKVAPAVDNVGGYVTWTATCPDPVAYQYDSGQGVCVLR